MGRPTRACCALACQCLRRGVIGRWPAVACHSRNALKASRKHARECANQFDLIAGRFCAATCGSPGSAKRHSVVDLGRVHSGDALQARRRRYVPLSDAHAMGTGVQVVPPVSAAGCLKVGVCVLCRPSRTRTQRTGMCGEFSRDIPASRAQTRWAGIIPIWIMSSRARRWPKLSGHLTKTGVQATAIFW